MEKLHVLILEDTLSDADLMEHELRKAGFGFIAKRVETRESFARELEAFHPDIVLSDYKLPAFDGLSALKMVRRDHPEVPVIMVTGALPDIEAAELIHAGAKDYVLKDRLARLAPAVQRVLSMEQGIRARKAAETALRENSRILERIFDSTHFCVVYLDRDFNFIRVNRAYARACGYPPEYFPGKNHFQLYPHEENEAIFRKVVQTGEPFTIMAKPFEFPDHPEWGVTYWDWTLHPLKEPDGNVDALLFVLLDVTGRKQSEARLKLFRTLLDNSTDGIEVIDPATLRFLDVNEAECRDLGYSREALLSMGIVDIDPTHGPDTVAMVEAQMRQMGSARFEGIHRRRDGSEFPVEISSKLIELDRPYVLSVVRDITERKKAESELFRLNRALKTLGDGNRALLRAGNEAELMKNMCEVITVSGGYLLAWIGFARQGEGIETMAIAGGEGGRAEALRLFCGDDGSVGTAIRSGLTQIAQDIGNDPRFGPWREIAAKYGFSSSIALPLKENGRVFGALCIYSGEAAAFSDHEVVLLEEMAEDLTFGIMNLRTRSERDQAVKERQHYAERLRESMEDALQAISATVEMRDPYTAGHQRRVADLAAAIAMEMGLPDEQVHGIHLAGIVHDLGKIRIPAEILSKPGKLSEIEYSLIRVHPQAGYDILKGIDFPWPIAQAVLQHHERLDGSGYPQGLKAGQILLEAKILAVADVVEAMSSHRPYRPGLGSGTALDEIRENRGICFDPAVVDACLALFAEKKFAFE